MRKSVKRALGVGIVGGAAIALWRAWNARVPPRDDGVEWSSAPFPFPPVPRPAAAPTPAAVEAVRAPAPPPASADGSNPGPKRAAGSAGAAKAARPKARAKTESWVEPAADGSCPASHPVKAKLSSGIFHVPGGANYARTRPDRCYADADAAIADGLRPAKA